MSAGGCGRTGGRAVRVCWGGAGSSPPLGEGKKELALESEAARAVRELTRDESLGAEREGPRGGPQAVPGRAAPEGAGHHHQVHPWPRRSSPGAPMPSPATSPGPPSAQSPPWCAGRLGLSPGTPWRPPAAAYPRAPQAVQPQQRRQLGEGVREGGQGPPGGRGATDEESTLHWKGRLPLRGRGCQSSGLGAAEGAMRRKEQGAKGGQREGLQVAIRN